MTNWTYMQKSDNDLMSSFSHDVKKYLGFDNNFPTGDLARWFLDSFQLLNMNIPNTYGDYSFIVVPSSKALEFWIFKIAIDLNIELNTNRAGVARDQIEAKINKVLDNVEEKLGNNIKLEIVYLKIFIEEYRNNIVHCNDKIESVMIAKNKVFAIYEKINSITEKLIKAGLIKVY